MTALRSGFEGDLERFTDLLGWVDNVSILLGVLLVTVGLIGIGYAIRRRPTP